MKRNILLSIIVIVIMTILFIAVVFASSDGLFELVDYNLKIGNETIQLKYPIYINNDRIYVPLRSFCDVLKIPVKWNDANSEVEIDINNKKIQLSEKTQFKEDGVIPDETTALVIGKTMLEKYVGKPLEYETNQRIYYLRVSFIETENAWQIVQNFKNKNSNSGGSTDWADFANIKLNKSTGEVLYINTHSTYVD